VKGIRHFAAIFRLERTRGLSPTSGSTGEIFVKICGIRITRRNGSTRACAGPSR
jgi:hypothetical protein